MMIHGVIYSTLCLFIMCLCCKSHVHDVDWEDDYYPISVSHFAVRKDFYTKSDVSRGRFELLNRNPTQFYNDTANKVSLVEFKKVLQCAKSEPGMNGLNGRMSMLKLIPPTTAIIERVTARIETNCQPWKDCPEILKKKRETVHCRDAYRALSLVRIINGSLYTDWPYCMDRSKGSDEPPFSMTKMMFHVLDIVNDMKDSVTFVGEERPQLPYDIIFPMISNTGNVRFMDIPFPWFQESVVEWHLNQHAAGSKNYSDEYYRTPSVPHYLPWEQRIPKAAFFSELHRHRHVLFDQAVLRPDLIDARWKCDSCNTVAYNPTSDETWDVYIRSVRESKHSTVTSDKPLHFGHSSGGGSEHHNNNSQFPTPQTAAGHRKVGYLASITPLHITKPVKMPIGQYKYLIVLIGIEGRATADRLANFLAHSGAVILLQTADLEYHFSARLKPWVHYVPLTFSTADVVDKIEWLKAHDDMARQIAVNAQNFGKSYLRLEDQYCYVATLLETLAALVENTDATVPYDPKPIKYFV